MGVRVREQDGHWFCFINHNGSRRAKQFPSKRAAELARDQIAAKLALGQVEVLAPAPVRVVAPKFPPLREALPEWIASRERRGDIRGATPSAYIGRSAYWTYPHKLPDGRVLGDVPVNEITREMLGGLVLRIKEAAKSHTIISHVRNPLVSFYDEMIETKVLAGPNPARDLKHFIGKRKPAKPVHPFTQEEVGKVMAAARALYPQHIAFIAVGFLGGLRFGEIAGLYRSDIDFKKGTIHVQRSYSARTRKMELPKNDRTRHVEACQDLLDALKTQLEQVALEGQVKGWDVEARQLVFPSPTGRPLRHRDFYSVWTRLLKKAGVQHHVFHSTRHSFATFLLEAGTDIRWVSRQLGHASVKQTLDVYSHLVPDHHKASAMKLNGIIG